MPGIPYPTTTNTIQAVASETGTSANDRVYTANISNTFVKTGLGSDYVTITTWNINLNMEGGDDVVEVYNQATLTGGAGSDYFVFDIAPYVGEAYTRSSTYVWATITDYSDGTDKIAILNNTGGVSSFSGLSLAQVGANVEITISANTGRIVLQNASLASLDASDFIFGNGSGATTITGTSGADTLNGTSASEIIIGLAGNDTMNGGGGDDTFRVSGTGDGFDTIDGGAGNDILEASAANTVIGLQGLTNVETVSSGGFANVSILTSTGNDVYDFSNITLNGIVKIDGNSGNDTITGNGAANTLWGSAGDDTLNGAGGDDVLNGGAGTNILNGGTGTDVAQYSGARSLYTVTQSGSSYVISGNGSSDTLTDVENVSFSDGTFAITSLLATAIPYPTTTNTIQAVAYETGTSANDRVYTANISNTFVNTGLGNDYVTLTTWNISLDMEGGNDVVEIYNQSKVTGGAGSDYFVFDIAPYVGEAYTRSSGYVWATINDYTDGVDKIAILNNTGGVSSFSGLSLAQVGANVEITISANTGRIVLQNTTLASLDASDFIFGNGSGGGGGGGTTTITGTSAAETLTGTSANEIIIGLGGNDTMNGGGGDDIFRVSGTSDGFDIIDGGAGNDSIAATAANTAIGLTSVTAVETISSGGFSGVSIAGSSTANVFDFSSVTLSGITSINGNAGNDTITGSAAADTILGGADNDTLNGGGGDDILNGGAGTNILNGGSGTDLAQYSAAKASYTVTQNSNGTYTISGNGSTDTLSAIENVQFSDGTFAIGSLVGGGGGGTTVTVNSIASLRAALDNTNVSTILIAPGNYTVSDAHNVAGATVGDAGFVVSHNVTIKTSGALGTRADFTAGTNFGKGLFLVIDGVSATFDGIGFFGTRENFGSSSFVHNEAGIRHEGANLTVLNSRFEQNYNAILGTPLPQAYSTANLLVQNSTFISNGDPGDYPGYFVPGQEHQIYFKGNSATIQNSTFTDSGLGHTIKTVALGFTSITGNTIVDGVEAANVINVTGGGNLTITGNNITRNSTAGNHGFIEYDTLRNGAVTGTVSISNNIIQLNGSQPVTLWRNASDATASITGNTITGTLSANTLLGDASFTGNTVNGVTNAVLGWRGTAQSLTSGNDSQFLTGGGATYLELDPARAINGLDGDDVIVASPDQAGADAFFGGLGNDVLAGGDGVDFLYGEGGDDTIFLGSSNTFPWQFASGGAGADFITVGPMDAGEGADANMDGGDGNDILDARLATGIVLIGGAGNDIIIGSNVLSNNNDAGNAINAGAGDDIVYAGLGYESELWGGTGIDTLIYDGNYGTRFTVTYAYGEAVVLGLGSDATAELGTYGGTYGGETAHQFEFIQFSNGVFDVATGVFSQGVTRPGANLATLLATAVPAYPTNTPPQTLTGTSAANTLNGGAGNDTITGLGGDDTLNGNGGNDIFRYTGSSEGFDIVDGGAGNDTVTATVANAVIGLQSITNVENITSGGFSGVSILGSSTANTFNFSSVTLTGITKIDGGAGNDIITGSAGNDVLIGGAGNDTLDGGAGTDTADYSAGTVNQTINLSLTTAQTISSGNVDTLSNIENAIGGTAIDTMTGTSGANVLNGGSGNDRITGGAGNDTIIGGVGTTDTAVFAGLQASYTIATNSGVVTVTDNQASVDGNDGVDTISGIERVEFKGGVVANVTSPIVLDLDGNGVQLVDNSNTNVSFDWNGDGKRDQTGWISRGDGFLVVDRDGNGTVSGADELSFVDDKYAAASDLDGLSAFDSNGDGWLSATDAQFGMFKVWRDANGNGQVDRGEMLSLQQAGIAAINLQGTAVNKSWNWGDNMTVNTGTFVRTDGGTGQFSDVALSYAEAQISNPSARLMGASRHLQSALLDDTSGATLDEYSSSDAADNIYDDGNLTQDFSTVAFENIAPSSESGAGSIMQDMVAFASNGSADNLAGFKLAQIIHSDFVV